MKITFLRLTGVACKITFVYIHKKKCRLNLDSVCKELRIIFCIFFYLWNWLSLALLCRFSGRSHRKYSIKNMFLKFSKNSKESVRIGVSFLIKFINKVSVIHENFQHSNFAWFLKNLNGNAFYNKNLKKIIWWLNQEILLTSKFNQNTVNLQIENMSINVQLKLIREEKHQDIFWKFVVNYRPRKISKITKTWNGSVIHKPEKKT